MTPVATQAAAAQLQVGPFTVTPPVVLAPMAGVTNAPFRTLCRRFSGGTGLYVSEMVMARALVEGSTKTLRMTEFTPDESPRSMQLYGSDPAVLGEAVRRLVGEGRVDHIDMNFGCPAAKVTRKGGGGAVPAKPRLLARIVSAAVDAASPAGVPVTIKFRKGLYDSMLTHVQTGRIGEDCGAAAVALHARTVEQHYAGVADWDAIGELKAAVTTIPVLGNGDIWEARDALEMMAATGCDGVVIGRGCLGKPWLFGDLVDAFAGKPLSPAPRLGEVAKVMAEHARLLCEWSGERGIRDFRKHTSWYLTGYPVGPAVRRGFSGVSSLAQLDDLLSALDPTMMLPPGAERLRRGHTNGPRTVHLPHRYLDDLDDDTPPDADDEMEASGG